MKNLFLMITLAIMAAIVMACGSNTPEPETVVKAESPQATATPKPSPTPDQKADLIVSLKAAWAEVVQDVPDNDKTSGTKEWQQEVKGVTAEATGLCLAHHQFEHIARVIDYYQGNKLGVKAEDFGTSDEAINGRLRTLGIAYVKALIGAPKGLPKEACDSELLTGWETAVAIYDALEKANLQPEDAGLTAKRIRELLLQGLRGRIADYKTQGKEFVGNVPPECDILDGLNNYHFTATDVGLSEEAEKKIEEQGCGG